VTDTESNNTLATAQAVNKNSLVSGTIASSSDTDYFKVTVASGSSLAATLTPNSSSDYDLYIYNASGTQLAKSEKSTGLVDSASVSNSGASAVTYYVRVLYYSGGTGATNGKYTLGIN
jgi:serine protease